MRRTLAGAALGVGVALTALPVAPAAAYCSQVFYALTGHCNECYLAAHTYEDLEDRSPLVPDLEFVCLA
jgi:hypothetical protein